ncbi:hypothetical protein SOVF_034510 [Spinacia oleracea]|uniref:Probable disease resistance protein At5g43740 n=1 Tax=Spinacia oleracea TaxID=3562 RepID=A0A9R0IAT3_SPIOL|nr:probable disease resistance protein At5g43740 [Spinacia oleracea]KNA22366.1 hypothetical protein SOVF_034510 [Spinacia oleracea]
MDALVVVGGILTLLTLLAEVPRFGERKRVLQGKFEYLRARLDDIENIERPLFSIPVQRTKKRKRDNEIHVWVAESRELLKVAENLLTQIEECKSFISRAKKRKVLENVVDALTVHDKKGDVLNTRPLSDEQVLHRGNHLPVQEIMGQTTLNTLEEIECLLQNCEVERVAIRGREGIGKTFLMKHLHNCVLKWVERFDYVFWVTSPEKFSIKHVQDAVAAVLKCDISSDDDLRIRGGILSNKLASLGSFVLFLDGVPNANFSLDEIGITVPTNGSECKLVLTTNSTSWCRILDGFETVEVDCLSENEAFELFLNEAKIDTKSVTLLNNIPRLLAERCGGVPRMIVNLATRMCGIEDLHEWRYALFEPGV